MHSQLQVAHQAAFALSHHDRAALAAELIASLDGEPDNDVEAAWATEIERRALRVHEHGPSGRPWSKIISELRGDA